ncbi:MAG: NACHT domain-containing protein, partial [Gammaproteobacteria bacterium]|nr:NACHT domain-containing protein [Gammaproteobacteria bacterium]
MICTINFVQSPRVLKARQLEQWSAADKPGLDIPVDIGSISDTLGDIDIQRIFTDSIRTMLEDVNYSVNDFENTPFHYTILLHYFGESQDFPLKLQAYFEDLRKHRCLLFVAGQPAQSAQQAVEEAMSPFANYLQTLQKHGIASKPFNLVLPPPAELAFVWESSAQTRISLLDVFGHRKSFLLMGEPGSGKTTALQSYANLFARKYTMAKERANDAGRYIPILIKLKHYPDFGGIASAFPMDPFETTLYRMILHELPESLHAAGIFKEHIAADEHCFVFLFDGLDTVNPQSLREQCQRDIYAFIHYLKREGLASFALVSSRPYGLSQHLTNDLRDLCLSYELLPLDQPQIERLLENNLTYIQSRGLLVRLNTTAKQKYITNPFILSCLIDLARDRLLIGRASDKDIQNITYSISLILLETCRNILLRELNKRERQPLLEADALLGLLACWAFEMQKAGGTLPDTRLLLLAGKQIEPHQCRTLIGDLVQWGIFSVTRHGEMDSSCRFTHDYFREILTALHLKSSITIHENRWRGFKPLSIDPYLADYSWSEVIELWAGLIQSRKQQNTAPLSNCVRHSSGSTLCR